jgi:hypothetical protein
MSLEEALAGGLTTKALQLWQARALLKEELRSRVTTWHRDEEIRFVKLGCRVRAGVHHQQSIPTTAYSIDAKVAALETAFDLLKSQKIVQENEIRKLKAQMLEETARSRRSCDGLAENRRVTEFEMAALKNELVDAKARMVSGYSSRSWRLTAPLRWCDEISVSSLGGFEKCLGGDD